MLDSLQTQGDAIGAQIGKITEFLQIGEVYPGNLKQTLLRISAISSDLIQDESGVEFVKNPIDRDRGDLLLRIQFDLCRKINEGMRMRRCLPGQRQPARNCHE